MPVVELSGNANMIAEVGQSPAAPAILSTRDTPEAVLHGLIGKTVAHALHEDGGVRIVFTDGSMFSTTLHLNIDYLQPVTR